MFNIQPCELERWYSRYGFRTRYNLSSSAAPSLTTADVLGFAGDQSREQYLNLDLNYGASEGDVGLRAAISRHYASIAPDQTLVTTGAVEALFLVLSTLLDAGDSVVVQTPIYPMIAELAQSRHVTVLPWHTDQQPNFADLDLILQRSRARVVVVNYPNSPTGATLTPNAMHALVACVEQHNAVLVADEVYRGIQFSGEPAPSAADCSASAVSIGDLAKPYGLGGLRIGWIATHNAKIRQRCLELHDYTTLCPSRPSEFLATIALQHSKPIMTKHLATAHANRGYFSSVRAALPWLIGELPAGGFTFFPQVTLDLPTAYLCQMLCQQYDTLVLPGDVFQRAGFVRIGFGQPPADFRRGVERLIACGQALSATPLASVHC